MLVVLPEPFTPTTIMTVGPSGLKLMGTSSWVSCSLSLALIASSTCSICTTRPRNWERTSWIISSAA